MTAEEIAAEIEKFANAQLRDDACKRLAEEAGVNALPALIERVSTVPPAKEFQRQAYAAFTLGLLGPAAVDAVEPMIAQLEGEEIHNGTRQHLVRALGAIAPGSAHHEAARAVLAAQTNHADPNVRLRASEAVELFAQG